MNFYPLSSPNPHTFTTFIYRERTREKEERERERERERGERATILPSKSLMFQKLLFKCLI
ncbi:hypothetical protein HanHA300_Chr13g0502211 [Helianthus annuus]|nr:hypothetical protein HanHA300_Chr13g0502211 [Helianthus annuus]KAJ0672980.1 hypothetical protein HanOQP8_Chr13g0503171 [Helianthus annuus]KAJ0851278.1 hypothetical protein HanPSC8_Chr13g0590371 [Helianthus annuus]